jgi:hypothetical protein
MEYVIAIETQEYGNKLARLSDGTAVMYGRDWSDAYIRRHAPRVQKKLRRRR